MYTIGIDFGTESARAVLVEVATGKQLATAIHPYRHGVIDRHLPNSEMPLPPDWALQDPADYLSALQQTVPAILQKSRIAPENVLGIAIDFTACTMMPALADGTPLCFVERWAKNPHAWVKLWKHHAAQAQADLINQTAQQLGESWLIRYGGKISSEWFFSKALQILQEAPEVYAAADRLIEASDWLIWQMTGNETRSACTAGYKAMVQDGDYPSTAFFAALDPRFADVVETKLSRQFSPLGGRAGSLTEQAAGWMGLPTGIAVAVANVDAHVTVPAVRVTEPGRMVMIMGTSTCHMLLDPARQEVEGMSGVVKDGIIPGFYGYEAGQSGVGDIFAWFVEHAVPAEIVAEAKAAGVDIYQHLEAEAAKLTPGESGMLALDWWNGNRSTLVDADLSGLLIGATIGTRAPAIYRTLIEATAFGTRMIIEAFEACGLAVQELIATGGLPEKNKLLVQLYADITGRPMTLVEVAQAPALGAAMHAAVAAGVYPTIIVAAEHMGASPVRTVQPIPQHQQVYEQLYEEYKRLYTYFGRGEAHGGNDVMKRLKRLKLAAHAR